jgi:hypothetical protein
VGALRLSRTDATPGAVEKSQTTSAKQRTNWEIAERGSVCACGPVAVQELQPLRTERRRDHSNGPASSQVVPSSATIVRDANFDLADAQRAS